MFVLFGYTIYFMGAVVAVLVPDCVELAIHVSHLVLESSDLVAIIHLVVECPYWWCFDHFGGEWPFW